MEAVVGSPQADDTGGIICRAWEPGFLSSCTPLLGLEILNIVVLSPVNEHKEYDLAEKELWK